MSTVDWIFYVEVEADQASGYGLGTLADPLRVLPGAEGVEQLDAILDALEAIQGTRPNAIVAGRRAQSSNASIPFFGL